jgi:hypothetical protein
VNFLLHYGEVVDHLTFKLSFHNIETVVDACSTSGTRRVKLYNKKLEVTIQFNFHTKMSFQSEQSKVLHIMASTTVSIL